MDLISCSRSCLAISSNSRSLSCWRSAASLSLMLSTTSFAVTTPYEIFKFIFLFCLTLWGIVGGFKIDLIERGPTTSSSFSTGGGSIIFNCWLITRTLISFSLSPAAQRSPSSLTSRLIVSTSFPIFDEFSTRDISVDKPKVLKLKFVSNDDRKISLWPASSESLTLSLPRIWSELIRKSLQSIVDHFVYFSLPFQDNVSAVDTEGSTATVGGLLTFSKIDEFRFWCAVGGASFSKAWSILTCSEKIKPSGSSSIFMSIKSTIEVSCCSAIPLPSLLLSWQPEQFWNYIRLLLSLTYEKMLRQLCRTKKESLERHPNVCLFSSKVFLYCTVELSQHFKKLYHSNANCNKPESQCKCFI